MFIYYRAIKNGKGVHSKKEPLPHRVAELSNVREDTNYGCMLTISLISGSYQGKAVSTFFAKSRKNCGISWGIVLILYVFVMQHHYITMWDGLHYMPSLILILVLLQRKKHLEYSLYHDHRCPILILGRKSFSCVLRYSTCAFAFHRWLSMRRRKAVLSFIERWHTKIFVA